MNNKTFGELLRDARLRTTYQTQEAFAAYLDRLGVSYTRKTISQWETNTRKPPNRLTYLKLLKALAEAHGITLITEVNHMLAAAGEGLVTETEQQEHFPTLHFGNLWPNLPNKYHEKLFGREDAVSRLAAELVNPLGKSVIVISGLGGIGKTALAHETAERVLSTGYFTNVLWESAKAEMYEDKHITIRTSRSTDWQSLVHRYATQLGLPIASNFQQVEAEVRFRLRGGGYLVVMDNLETIEAAIEVAHKLHELVNPTASAKPSKVLITSRERLTRLSYTFDYFIGGLEPIPATEFLYQNAESRNIAFIDRDPMIEERIYNTTKGMPLAIILINSQRVAGQTVDEILERIEKTTNERELYQFIYWDLWQKIGVKAQKVLAAAAAFGISSQRSHLMRVSKTEDPPIFDDAIAELVRLSLMEVIHITQTFSSDNRRYDIHSITRWFVNGPLQKEWENYRNSRNHSLGDSLS